MSARQRFRSVPLVGPAAARLRQVIQNRWSPFAGSSSYWETRYRSGGDSGAGSRDRLAEFKAEVLNQFVREHEVTTVLEFGCGDGAQLTRAEYPRYVGCDVSPAALRMCRARFAGDPSKRFLLLDELPRELSAELTLSLDVIYHLVEDEVFRAHMECLFDHAERYVIVYSSNREAAHPLPHLRHREFTAWVRANRPGWRLVATIPNAYPYDRRRPFASSFADFFVYEKVA